MKMDGWVKTVGLSILLIGIISIIVSKFRGIDDIDSTANASLGDGLTLLGDMEGIFLWDKVNTRIIWV